MCALKWLLATSLASVMGFEVVKQEGAWRWYFLVIAVFWSYQAVSAWAGLWWDEVEEEVQ